jgi:hypothetical protein
MAGGEIHSRRMDISRDFFRKAHSDRDERFGFRCSAGKSVVVIWNLFCEFFL